MAWGKSKYCLRWKLLNTGADSNASCSTELRMFIRGTAGLLRKSCRNRNGPYPARKDRPRALYGSPKCYGVRVDERGMMPYPHNLGQVSGRDRGAIPYRKEHPPKESGPAWSAGSSVKSESDGLGRGAVLWDFTYLCANLT